MIIAWRNFRFQQGEVGTNISRENLRNEAGDVYARRERWILDGMILNRGGTLSSMKTLIEQAENAFQSDYGDLVMYEPNGSSRTAHYLINANTIGGTRVISPVSFPRSEGTEGITYRSFTAIVEGDIPVANPDSLLQSWNETITFTGGGPATEHQETLYGRPIKYTARQQTKYTATQSGSAVGLYFYPTPSFPMWPDAEKRNLRSITKGTPKPTGLRKMFWPISWQYTFESADQLNGSPTGWPRR